uniref:Uncharacterized protein n=1 Tax=Anopheles darlingi TaxID=43151 RepID=A0A2M4D601_ANODA
MPECSVLRYYRFRLLLLFILCNSVILVQCIFCFYLTFGCSNGPLLFRIVPLDMFQQQLLRNESFLATIFRARVLCLTVVQSLMYL